MANGDPGAWRQVSIVCISLMIGAGFTAVVSAARAESVRDLEVRVPLVEQRMDRFEQDIDRVLIELGRAIAKMDRYHEAR